MTFGEAAQRKNNRHLSSWLRLRYRHNIPIANTFGCAVDCGQGLNKFSLLHKLDTMGKNSIFPPNHPERPGSPQRTPA